MTSDSRVIGRTVGRYEILRQLGRGAMATVYLARQLDLDRGVALKELDRIGTGESPVFATRFLREARLAGSLSHANIVTVYDYFEHEGRPYIAMEHVEGGSLREHLDGLSLTQIIGVLEGLLAALTHAEARAIVHRDIKPENILVTADGRVKIADFGIAKAYSLMTGALLTATGTIVGTPMYMAPEQATGKSLGTATDLYAVGIVAFEMLFGYVPFRSGDSPVAIIWQHVNEPVPDPHALRPDLDPRLCRWLERLLAKDATDRPGSATAALDELEEIADELLGSRWRREAPLLARAARAPDVPPPEPPPPPPRLQTSVDGRDPASAASEPPSIDATRDAGGTTIAPRELREQTEHYGRTHRDRAADDVPSSTSKRGWSVDMLAVVVAATLVAGGGGYLAFHRDAATPPPVRSQPASPESVVSKRFADGLGHAFERLNGIRVSARKQMKAAKTARKQALQARTIASAYRRASVDVDKLTPPADQRAAAALLGDKLARAGRAYDALGNAAVTRRGYDARRYAIGVHESAVKRAAGQLDGTGKAPS